MNTASQVRIVLTMFGQTDSMFSTQDVTVPAGTHVIFVADFFVEDYVGGAELTSEALITSSPYKVHKLHSRDVSMEVLRQNVDKFWIFGNFTQINPQLIPSIVANIKYGVLEYDYKYCKHRSPEKHFATTGLPCDCHNQLNGKLISSFFYGAKYIWWMSEAQKNKYFTIFPFLDKVDNSVLSSVFDRKTLGMISVLRNTMKDSQRSRWIVLGSDSWVKGKENAIKHCEDNNLPYTVLWNVSYEKMLSSLAAAEGFVYLPNGADTCPRMVIEAKLLGCKLVINDHVQHSKEEWFADASVEQIEEYLYAAPKIFWTAVKTVMQYAPSISGYTTTYNCIKQSYPFVQSIKSMLTFCDEVCVVDGGSTDGTLEKLASLSQEDSRVKIKVVERDWNHPRASVFDGMQKAEARKMCTGEFCWQMDVDEIVHESYANKVKEICSSLPREINLVSLPVIEYWGSLDKVRLDVAPWKWRLSRNKPNITHGIPFNLRATDVDGNVYAIGGTDGCDMIDAMTGVPIEHVSFYSKEADDARKAALAGNIDAKNQYERWFNDVVENLPGVFHYSWLNIERKIRLYRDYWTTHWLKLWNKSTDDSAENNMFFDVPWSEVTDEMIAERAKQLAATGGHVFHTKWNGTITPHIRVAMSQPEVMSQ